MTPAQFRKINRGLMTRLEEIERHQATVDGARMVEDLASAPDVPSAWGALDLDRQRVIVDMLVTVKLLPEEKRGARVFRPELVQIRWKS